MEQTDKIISWAITNGCNAHQLCDYCIAKVEHRTKNIHPPEETLKNIVNGINRLNPNNIYINGGEPFAVKGFVSEVVSNLIANNHRLFVTSNFLAKIDDYIQYLEIAGENLISLNLSYHKSLFSDYLVFINKLERLIAKNRNNNKILVSAVLHPSYLDEIRALDIELNKRFQIKIYPQYLKIHDEYGLRKIYKYSEEQTLIIKSFIDRKFNWVPFSTRNAECLAGKKYIFINCNGEVFRCQSYFEKNKLMGIISNPDFKLLEQSEKCEFDYCSCGSAQSSKLIQS